MFVPSQLQNFIVNIKNVNIVTKEYALIAVFTQARPLKSLHCKTAFPQYVHPSKVTSQYQDFYPHSQALTTLISGLP